MTGIYCLLNRGKSCICKRDGFFVVIDCCCLIRVTDVTVTAIVVVGEVVVYIIKSEVSLLPLHISIIHQLSVPPMPFISSPSINIPLCLTHSSHQVGKIACFKRRQLV